jgi:ribonuclease T1
MSDQTPPSGGSNRAALYAIIVALVVAAIYFLNTTGMGLLLPEQYNVDLTAEATAVAQATQEAAAATEAASGAATKAVTPEPAAGSDADAATEEADGSASSAAAGAEQEAEPPAEVAAAEAEATFPARVNGLPTIAFQDLPPEAGETVALIAQGGPFPFNRDGGVFENREGLLPDQPVGYYADYTVLTPGQEGRGERRLIQGAEGELYYTDDRYESFSFVVDAPAIGAGEASGAAGAVAAASPTRQPTSQPTQQPTAEPTATPRPQAAATATFPARINGLPTIAIDDLPPDAWETIALIDSGGPFPFDRDGITFENREGLLPDRSRGYYREFTVITPGASTRGARRIIEGEEGELYYTDDHYDSFSYVVR